MITLGFPDHRHSNILQPLRGACFLSKGQNKLPVYMDRHYVEGATRHAVADAHQKDLALQDKYEFKRPIDDWIHVFRNTKPAPGTNGPLIPGDRERAAEAIGTTERIPLRRPGMNDL